MARTIYKWSSVLVGLASILTGATAFAAEHARLNGVNLVYEDLVTPVEVGLSTGTLNTNGTNVAVADATYTVRLATGSAPCDGGLPNTNEALYLYYNAGTVTGNIMASTVAPSLDGMPLSSIEDFTAAGACTLDQSGFTFVGSIVDDGSGGIVPFVRTGDQVRLTPKIDIGTGCGLGTDCSSWTDHFLIQNATKAAPISHSIGSVWSFLPATAKAVITDMEMSSSASGGNYFILSPTDQTFGTNCNAISTTYIIPNMTNEMFLRDMIVPLGGAAQAYEFLIGSCSASATGFTPFFDLRGYIEDVNHLY